MDESQADSTPPADAALPSHYPCPSCGESVEPSDRGAILQCSHCGTQFFPPAPQDSQEEEAESSSTETDDEAELSELRIRQLVTLRRSAYRTRTYFIVGVVACTLLCVMLVKYVYQSVRLSHHWELRDSTGSLFAVAALIGAFKFAHHVSRTQREIDDALREREREEAEAAKVEPDLSTLSDGSQHWKHLEQIQREGNDE